jgi:hypothetical protein
MAKIINYLTIGAVLMVETEGIKGDDPKCPEPRCIKLSTIEFSEQFHTEREVPTDDMLPTFSMSASGTTNSASLTWGTRSGVGFSGEKS